MECSNYTALVRVVRAMTETLHFFEPAKDKELSPVYLAIPSLCTLSPNHRRIHTYSKGGAVSNLFFPVWSNREYKAVGRNQNIALPEIEHRFYRYGGIIRHLFATRKDLDRELDTRLQKDNLGKFLLAEVTDVDTVTGAGCPTRMSLLGDKSPLRIGNLC
jgi:hypothetical protein